MKRTYLNPECRFITVEAVDVITVSDNLFGQILRFGDFGYSDGLDIDA